VKSVLVRAGLAALCAVLLVGCVDSKGSILADSRPVLGSRLKLQLYSMRKGYAEDPEQASFAWNGTLYAHAGGGMTDVRGFSVHPFEGGDYIIQSVSVKRPQMAEYALMRQLTDGVYHVVVIDEADADAATRAAHCAKLSGAACRIATREQLFAFARATAARRKRDGGLAIRLPDGAERR
jgi:hypothetical protein